MRVFVVSAQDESPWGDGRGRAGRGGVVPKRRGSRWNFVNRIRSKPTLGHFNSREEPAKLYEGTKMNPCT